MQIFFLSFVVEYNIVTHHSQTENEFSTNIISQLQLTSGTESSTQHTRSNLSDYPSSMDWRERGFVTEVSHH